MAKVPKPRYWKPDEIKVLPKELRNEFFGQDTSGWKFKKKTELSKNEHKTLAPILKAHKFTEIWRIPEVLTPSGVQTPDLWIDRVKTEIKSATTIGSIQSQIRSASKQVGEAGRIILDVSESPLSNQELFKEIAQKLNRYNKATISADVIKENAVIGTISKSPAQSAKGAEGRDFYEIKISQKPQKVNSDRFLAPKTTKPRLRTQSRTYWQKRSVERTLESERQSLPYLRQSRQVYAKSARKVTKQVQDIYAKYYKDNGFDVQALRQLAPQGDVLRLKARMRKLGLETELPDNYAFRVNRLELLNLQMRAEAYETGQKIKQITGKCLSKTYENSYYRTIYDTARGIGHTPAFSQLNVKTVSKILDSKHYGENFSERIWGRSQKLGVELQNIVSQAVATGQAPAKTARLLRERFNVSTNAAARLIRTETNYYENQAELDSYREMRVEEYQFIATIDTKTSEVCQHLDHKVFKVKDAKPGVNMPPMHPNCRSTITAYFGKEWEPEVRIARDPATGRNEYVTNMSYQEWADQFVAKQATEQNASVVNDLISVDNLLKYSPMRFAKHDRNWLDEIITQAKELINENPELRDQMRSKGGILLETGRSKVSKASTPRDNSKITLHRSFLDRPAYLKELEAEIKSGFKVKVPKNKMPIYTITHEIGHIIENFLMGKSVNNDALARSIQRDIINLAKQASGKTVKELQAQVSGYGHQNAREFFAEVYADYKLNGKSDMAQAMGKYLKSRFNHGKRKNVTILHDK